MNAYLPEFFHQVKRLIFNRFYLAVLLTMMLLTLYCVHRGVIEHQNIIVNSKDFKQCEKITFERIPDYDKYSDYGFRVYFIPAASSVFFSNPEILSDLNARINSIVTMDIYNNTKNSSLFKRKFPIPLRYSIIVLLLGGAFCLAFGYGALRQKEHLKSLSSASSHWTVYSLQILPRFFVIVLSLVLISGINLGFALLKNIEFTGNDIARLSAHFLIALLTLEFFFFLGVVTGFFTRGKWSRGVLMGSVFVLFIIILPLIIYSIIEEKSAKLTSSYKMESQKVSILKNFEEEAKKNHGEFDPNDLKKGRKVVKKYLEKDHMQIVGIEKQLRDEILKVIEEQETLCMLTPVTFYLTTGEEVSGRGYRGYIVIYDYVIESHNRFLLFWIQRVYYHDPEIMVNFIQADENLFKSTSALPNNYWTGVSITCGYILVMLLVSFLLYNQSLYRLKSKDLKSFKPSLLSRVSFTIGKGKFLEFKTNYNITKNILYLQLSGKNRRLTRAGYSGKVVIDGVNIALEKFTGDFLYICRPEELAEDITVKDCIITYARLLELSEQEKMIILDSPGISPISKEVIGKLSQAEKFEILVGLLRVKRDWVYLVNDIDKDLSTIYSIQLKERIDELIAQGAAVIFLTSYTASKDVKNDTFFEKSDLWTFMVEENKKIIEICQQKEKEQGEKS